MTSTDVARYIDNDGQIFRFRIMLSFYKLITINKLHSVVTINKLVIIVCVFYLRIQQCISDRFVAFKVVQIQSDIDNLCGDTTKTLIFLIGHVRISKRTKCRCGVKIVDRNVLTYAKHNHNEDEETEIVISMMELRSDVKTLGVLRPDEKPLNLITECVQKRGVRINERQSSNIRRALNRKRRKVF